MLSCDNATSNQGCSGGTDILAYKFMHENEITDETCSIYQAKGWTNGLTCTDFVKCGDCLEDKGCWVQNRYFVY